MTGMTELVGILNVTPDSFSDGGEHFYAEDAKAYARQLFDDGAALVDVGAESTRPNATKLTADEEWERLKDVLPVLMKQFPGKISLDTYHPETVERALELGDVIINDVTGLTNPRMVELVKRHKPRVIISHLPATDVQVAHAQEPLDDEQVVKRYLLKIAKELEAAGVPHENIILDPGIGFGKTMELNKRLLEFPKLVPNYPVMIGHSRKRFLGERRMELEPNLAAAQVAVQSGAKYLRVHDVAGHRPLLKT